MVQRMIMYYTWRSIQPYLSGHFVPYMLTTGGIMSNVMASFSHTLNGARGSLYGMSPTFWNVMRFLLTGTVRLLIISNRIVYRP